MEGLQSLYYLDDPFVNNNSCLIFLIGLIQTNPKLCCMPFSYTSIHSMKQHSTVQYIFIQYSLTIKKTHEIIKEKVSD